MRAARALRLLDVSSVHVLSSTTPTQCIHEAWIASLNRPTKVGIRVDREKSVEGAG
jgi:hypothetical protein